MIGKFVRNVSLVVLAGLASLSISAAAQAGTVQLGNSGWSATWSSSQDAKLSLNVDFESADTVFIEKFLQVLPGDLDPGGFFNPAVVVFQQTASNAKPFIVINDEQVVNASGVAWNGFTMTILGGPGVSFDAGRTDISPPGAGFSIDPFTTYSFTNGDTLLNVSGATIPSGPAIPGPGDPNVWLPGARSGGLAIVASPLVGSVGLRSFSFKETPSTGAIAIPLPAAVWTGLSGLFALALLGSARHMSVRSIRMVGLK